MSSNSVSSNQAVWFPGLLTAVLKYLDLSSLLSCERVSNEWLVATQDRSVWEELYCAIWRCGVPLPASTKRLDLLAPEAPVDWRAVCKQRRLMPLEPSTRAKWWIHPGQTLHVHNQGLQRAINRVCVESVRTEQPLQPLLLSYYRRNGPRTQGSRRRFDKGVCYFEAHVRGSGSVGLASISTQAERQFYGFGSSFHVGWLPVSYGYHNDDGYLYWNDGPTRLGGRHAAYGPRWGELHATAAQQPITTVGCGLELDTGRLFFTKDGQFLGHTPRPVVLTREYAAAVSLHHLGDMAELNLGRTAFVFDIDAYIAERYASDVAASQQPPQGG